MKRVPFSVSVVIPLYNNASTLADQLTGCIKVLNAICQKYEILICEDKSTDNSAVLLRKHFRRDPRIRLLFHKKNQGIAPTIHELYSKAKYDYIMLYSVDGDWDATDIEKLIRLQQKTKADIVVGERDKSVYSAYRKLISYFYDLLTKILFGVDTIDAGSIKIFKKSLIKTLGVQSKSLFFEAELIIRAASSHLKIASCPIAFHKKDSNSGTGAKLTNVLSTFFDLIKLRLQLSKEYELRN